MVVLLVDIENDSIEFHLLLVEFSDKDVLFLLLEHADLGSPLFVLFLKGLYLNLLTMFNTP